MCHYVCQLTQMAQRLSRLLSVGRFGYGRGLVFRYSRYSIGSLRGEAPHNSWVGEVRRGRRQPPPQEMQGEVWGRLGPQKINFLMSVSVRIGTCFGSVGFAFKSYIKSSLDLEIVTVFATSKRFQLGESKDPNRRTLRQGAAAANLCTSSNMTF
jgi:hypothetical protein